MEQFHENVPEENALPEESSFEATVPMKETGARQKKVKIDPLTGQVKRGFWAEEWYRLKKHRSIIWFVLPAFFLAFLFGYVPMVGLAIAFRDQFPLGSGSGFQAALWAWSKGVWSLENFSKLIESDVLKALGNTLILNVIGIVFIFPLPIICALFLAEIKNSAMSKLMLIILCLPNFLSWSMTIGIWSKILNPVDGLINNFLVDVLHVRDEGFYFLGSNEWFKPLVIFFKIWKGTGWSSIIYYAAIASIDKSFFEAATLDGASKFQKIIWITLPTIVPVIGLSLIMTLTYIMSVGLELVMAMYTPETRGDQMVLDAYIYDISLGSGMSETAFPTLIGIVNGLIALFLMLGGNAISKKLLHTSLW